MAQQIVDPATLDEMITLARTDELSRCALADALEEMGRVADAEDIRHAFEYPLHPLRFHVRWMLRPDVEQVAAIGPWSRTRILNELRGRAIIGMVVEDTYTPIAPPIAAFVIYRLHKHHLELRAMQVDSRYRRRGVAHRLFERLRSKLCEGRRPYMVSRNCQGLCPEWFALHLESHVYEEIPS